MSAVRGSLGPSYLQPGGSRSITSRPSQVTSRAAPATSGARGKRAVKASARSSPSGALAPEPLAGAPDRFLEAQAQDLSVQESAQYGHCTDTVGQSVQGAAAPVSRRGVMAAPLAQLLAGAVAPIVTSMASIVTSTVAFPPLPALATVTPARIDASTQPSASFDPTDEGLRRAAEVFQSALDAKSVQEEEAQWTKVIEIAEGAAPGTPWVGDILSRSYGNRGNARSRQGKLEQAIEDYNKSIELAPYAPDPVLNRGVALESLRRFEEAAADYEAVLAFNPYDPAAWNNLGNVMAATGQWEEAAKDYKRASDLAPEFSFAGANFALALYQLGEDNKAIKQMRSLLRRYPEFPDMRAALAVALYKAGVIGDAETNWTRLEDLRYKNVEWVRDVRRWPPRLVDELEKFLAIAPA